jgi:hypothetical protein
LRRPPPSWIADFSVDEIRYRDVLAKGFGLPGSSQRPGCVNVQAVECCFECSRSRELLPPGHTLDLLLPQHRSLHPSFHPLNLSFLVTGRASFPAEEPTFSNR